MAKTNEKVKPSNRSKIMAALETPEELQKGIQSLYSDAKKMIAKVKETNVFLPMMKDQEEAIKHYVNETNDINSFSLSTMQNFWSLAYSHNENIINLINS